MQVLRLSTQIGRLTKANVKAWRAHRIPHFGWAAHTSCQPTRSIQSCKACRHQLAAHVSLPLQGSALRHPKIKMSTVAAQAAGAADPASNPGLGVMIAYVTCGNQESANKLSDQLIEANLAACVNIVPGLTSVYKWEGKVEHDQELLLIIKTKESLMPELTEFVKKNHPYDEPEVIGLPVQAGSPSYLSWVLSNTKP